MSTARLVSFGPSATLVAAAVISTKLPTDDSAWYHIDFGTTKPSVLAQSFLVSIVLLVAVIKLLQRQIANNNNNVPETKKETSIIVKPKSVRTLQIKFLTVFWLMRFAFWMAGPYFYAAFASKKIHGGQPMPVTTISHISLTGYAAIAVLGPWAGKISQAYGKRVASIVGMVCYGLGTLSITSHSLPILFLGRICSGVGQSILSNAPESWFIAEIKQKDRDPNEKFLGETFGLAYSLDSIVAIAAGQLAQWAAASRGPTGPFTYSPWFLVLGAIVVLFSWTETAPMTASADETKKTRSSPSIQDTLRIIMANPKIICLGIVQSLFEAAMYIFVITWAPLMLQTIHASIGNSETTPYGKIFSCFMAACMLGSTFFTILNKMIRLERVMIILLATATMALVSSLWTISNNSTPDAFFRLFFSFLAFEACVGIYFPTIGTIRASILPDSHRSAIMTLFAVPLNALVVTCFLLLDKHGHNGSVMVAAGAVGVATMTMIWLDLQSRLDRQQQAIGRFQKAAHKIKLINMVCIEFAARLGANGQVYVVDGKFSRRESRSSFASLNAPMT